MGFGWHNKFGAGRGADAITSGLEVTWTTTPTQWSNDFFEHLFSYEWELSNSPAGTQQWVTKGAAPIIPHAHDPSKKVLPMMLTTDLSLRFDPAYEKFSRRFLAHPGEFANAFARAWFKLTHRDLGPKTRYLGPEVPAEEFIWQDPIPKVDHTLVDERDISELKGKLLASGLTVSQLVSTAWASASTYRGSDMRGGADGARIRLAPQKDWAVNQPDQLGRVLMALEIVRAEFNGDNPRTRGSRSPTSSCWAVARQSSRRRRTPASPYRCRSRQDAWMLRPSRPMHILSRCSSRTRTVSETTARLGLQREPKRSSSTRRSSWG